MKAIYFPFTYITEQTAAAVTPLFESLIVYMPSTEPIPEEMMALAGQGLIDIRIPIEKEQAKLMAAHQEFLNWGNANQKDILSSLKNRSASPYLFDDSWSMQIKTDIQKGPKSKTDSAPDGDFSARLFLLITQTHDQHHHEMRKKVQAIEKMEKSLFSDLQAEVFQAPGTPSRPLSKGEQDPGIYMTKERLASWTALFAHDKPCPGNLFVTSSPGVWDYILDLSENTDLPVEDLSQLRTDSPAEDRPYRLPDILDTLQKQQFDSPASRLVTAKTTASDNKTMLDARFLIIPHTTPDQFFGRLTGHDIGSVSAGNPELRNTLIGLIHQ